MNTPTISLVINTRNASSTLAACIQSAKAVVNEIVVMDMESEDDTRSIAKSFGARILRHPNIGYVEPARNAAIKATTSDWILILDADEELHEALAPRLAELVATPGVDAYSLPRQNIIFGRPVQSGWWPDYQLRLFRKGTVMWPDEIHGKPTVKGVTRELPAEVTNSILHHNYDTVDSFVDRVQRYSAIEAKDHAQAKLPSSFFAPFFDELLRRYYAWDAQSDGRHGQALALLQSWQRLMTVLKTWEARDFADGSPIGPSLVPVFENLTRQARYWEAHRRWRKAHGLAKWYWRVRMKLSL